MKLLDNLKQQARHLKNECRALLIAYRDPRTPWLARSVAAFTVAYLLSPIDLIPDFIPVLGILDDLILVPWLIRLSIRLIPAEVMADARQKALDAPVSGKNNWLFGGAIIALWLLAIFFTVKFFLK